LHTECIIAQNSSTPPAMSEPIYDDIELTNQTNNIDVSKNIAYM